MISFVALSAGCFAVFSGLHFPAYAAIAIAGMIAALFLSQRTARLSGLSPEKLWDAGVFAILAAFVISRALGFLLLLVIEHGQLTLSFREVLSFSSISYLSLLVTAVPVMLWLRWKGLPLLRTMDAWAPCGALLWGALSLADAASGAEGGLPTRLPWGVRTAGSSVRVHPVALYGAAAALALSAVLLHRIRRMDRPGRIAGVALIATGVLTFLLDMLRLPEQPLAHTWLEPSQWISLAAILLGTSLVTFVRYGESL
jgi:phosphatidylglycerol:prolipoprotein diacylglycerol transferase